MIYLFDHPYLNIFATKKTVILAFTTNWSKFHAILIRCGREATPQTSHHRPTNWHGNMIKGTAMPSSLYVSHVYCCVVRELHDHRAVDLHVVCIGSRQLRFLPLSLNASSIAGRFWAFISWQKHRSTTQFHGKASQRSLWQKIIFSDYKKALGDLSHRSEQLPELIADSRQIIKPIAISSYRSEDSAADSRAFTIFKALCVNGSDKSGRKYHYKVRRQREHPA